jgi:hypothetical protein
MFKNIQLVFGLTVGLVLMVLGALFLLLSPTGWSLIAVGLAVTAVNILLNLPEKPQFATIPLLLDNTGRLHGKIS